MDDFVSEATRRFVSLAGPEPDGTQQAMQAHAEEAEFPIIGPSVGGLLTALAQLTDARNVFEFGSGFGYSASWLARGMADGSEMVLTEVDVDELDLAREFLGGGNYPVTFTYDHADAVEAIERYDGPFDIVLVDHEKSRYVDAFERVREKVRPGGCIVADNMMHAAFEIDDVLEGLEGGQPPDESSAGVVNYIERLRDASDFESVVLPLGNGVGLGVRRR